MGAGVPAPTGTNLPTGSLRFGYRPAFPSLRHPKKPGVMPKKGASAQKKPPNYRLQPSSAPKIPELPKDPKCPDCGSMMWIAQADWKSPITKSGRLSARAAENREGLIVPARSPIRPRGVTLTRLRFTRIQGILASIATGSVCRPSFIDKIAVTIAFSKLRVAFCSQTALRRDFGREQNEPRDNHHLPISHAAFPHPVCRLTANLHQAQGRQIGPRPNRPPGAYPMT